MSKPVINPSDIRPGDRIRITRELTVDEAFEVYNLNAQEMAVGLSSSDIPGKRIDVLGGVEVKLLERPKRLPKDAELVSATSGSGFTTYFERAANGKSWYEDGDDYEESEEYVIQQIERISEGRYVVWTRGEVGQL